MRAVLIAAVFSLLVAGCGGSGSSGPPKRPGYIPAKAKPLKTSIGWVWLLPDTGYVKNAFIVYATPGAECAAAVPYQDESTMYQLIGKGGHYTLSCG